MASLSSFISPGGRASDPTFRVSTREISLDLTNVGPAESPNELGALNETAFRDLLARFASLPAVKLLDGAPRLVVSAKRGRYAVMPSSGLLLVRPANDSQQPYVKFSVDDLPGYLDSTDQQNQAQAPAKNIQTLIGAASTAAAARAPAVPENAPIYGNIPISRPTASAPAPATAPAAQSSAGAPPKRRALLYVVGTVFVLAVAGAGWILFRPAEPPPPPAPRTLSEFEVVSSPDLVASLKKRFVGTYATSGDAGERLLEINADGTFHYQEFGAGVSTTANRKGTYTFALRAANKAPVIRASTLGTIELRDEKNLLWQGGLFTRLP